jgi:hypothetical protein
VDRALAPRPPGPPPQFSFNNIEIEDGAITLDDRLADRRHEIAALTIAVPFVSSLPYATDIRVTPRMEGTFNGSHFALKGSATPFAERRETTLDIDLDALKLPPYVAYLPSRPTLDLAGGALTTRLTDCVRRAGPTDRRLELRGNALRGRAGDQAARRHAARGGGSHRRRAGSRRGVRPAGAHRVGRSKRRASTSCG